MATRHRQLNEQEREQRRAEQRELVKASVEQLRSSEGWQAWLRARRTFHSYSVGNMLLILQQHPTATRVAGFRAWLRLGYAVQKGSRGIKIWAPCPPSQRQLEQWRAAGADPAQKPRTFWRLSSVFAQDQVAPLPPPAQPVPLDPPVRAILGDSHDDLIAPLVELASEIGYTVSFEEPERGDGFCDPKCKRIVIAVRLEANARLATLIHELAHALMRAEPEAAELSYAQEELVVESVAHCACQLVGLDVSANSIPYLASWAERASLEVLEQSAQLTDRLARRIEERLLSEAAAVEPAEEQTLHTVQAVRLEMSIRASAPATGAGARQRCQCGERELRVDQAQFLLDRQSATPPRGCLRVGVRLELQQRQADVQSVLDWHGPGQLSGGRADHQRA